MDWFDQEEDIFENVNNSFTGGEHVCDLENLFIKKQNSEMDYEVKMEEFVLDKGELKGNSKVLHAEGSSNTKEATSATKMYQEKFLRLKKEKFYLIAVEKAKVKSH